MSNPSTQQALSQAEKRLTDLQHSFRAAKQHFIRLDHAKHEHWLEVENLSSAWRQQGFRDPALRQILDQAREKYKELCHFAQRAQFKCLNEEDELHLAQSELQRLRRQARTPDYERMIAGWRRCVEESFADYTKLQTFPCPPSTRACTDLACFQKPGVLPACKCKIRAAFERVPDLDLRRERQLWHPDRFSACPHDRRKTFRVMAKEICAVLDDM